MCWHLAIDTSRLLRMAALRGDAFVAVGTDNVLFAAVMTQESDSSCLVESAGIGFADNARCVTGFDSDGVSAQPQQHNQSS